MLENIWCSDKKSKAAACGHDVRSGWIQHTMAPCFVHKFNNNICYSSDWKLMGIVVFELSTMLHRLRFLGLSVCSHLHLLFPWFQKVSERGEGLRVFFQSRQMTKFHCYPSNNPGNKITHLLLIRQKVLDTQTSFSAGIIGVNLTLQRKKYFCRRYTSRNLLRNPRKQDAAFNLWSHLISIISIKSNPGDCCLFLRLPWKHPRFMVHVQYEETEAKVKHEVGNTTLGGDTTFICAQPR